MKRIIILLLLCILVNPYSGFSQLKHSNLSKPWTYWWWMGNSVSRKGITENLKDMNIAGIGGVHIVPIYGEKGDENNFIKYLSPEWMEMLKYTTDEASRLGMGVDMTSGTGWPFGGPNVTSSDAAKAFYVVPVEPKVQANILDYAKTRNNAKLVALVAYDEKGKYQNITSQVHPGGTASRSRV